jgi:hypothetical protein
MLLEGLSAEQALARVRERHPEAHPDPYHWFALRHLRESTTPQRRARHRTCDVPRHTPQLARPVVAGRVGHL